MKILVVLAALVAASPSIALSQDQIPYEPLEGFQLYTHCQSLHTHINVVEASDSTEIELSGTSVQSAVESRLRAARVFASSEDYGNPWFSVWIHLVGRAFNVRVELEKWFHDSETDYRWTAITWRASITGTHGQDAGYVRTAVSELIDEFLADYLRVNEEACL